MHQIITIIESFIASFDTFGLILIIALTLIGSIVAGMSGYGAGILIGVVLMPMVGVKKIVPIVTILTFYINIWRIILYWEHINWKKSIYFSIFAEPGLYFSTYFFSVASTFSWNQQIIFYLNQNLDELNESNESFQLHSFSLFCKCHQIEMHPEH